MNLWERFEAQAVRTPENVAALDSDRSVTYGWLLEEVERLREHLRGAGISPGQYIGVLSHRSVDTVALMLAVMAERAVYVPFDPDHPPLRMKKCQEVLGIGALLQVADDRELIATDLGTRTSLSTLSQNDHDPRSSRGSAADVPAYAIFTSGSTGEPKACIPRHSNVLAFLDGLSARHLGEEPETSLLLHSFAFDFSVWEMWMAFLTGGRVVIAPSFLSHGLDVAVDLCERHAVTVMCCVPSLLDVLLNLGLGHRARSLTKVYIGGDRLQKQTLDKAFDTLHSRPQLVHIYGVTEATVLSTTKILTSDVEWPDNASPIGQPIAGTIVRIVDDSGKEAEVGQIGEIVIGGPTVIDGYVRRGHIDSERFKSRPGPHVHYHTGDYGYADTAGELYFVGRRDDQVQVNGVRVECGEVQRALLALSGVADACVIPIIRKHGQSGIGAVVVYDGDAAELRTRLGESVVGAGVPTLIGIVERLPVNTSGKVDRAKVRELLDGRSPR